LVDVFFYGTLRFPALLETVLGRVLEADRLQPACLPGFAVHWAEGQSYPLILAAPDGDCAGLLARDLDAQDVARLDFYEGGFGYVLRPVSVVDGQGDKVAAQVFFPPDASNAPRPGAVFELDDWAERWGAISVRAAGEAMDFFGRITAQEMARRLPGIRRRAASWLAAQARPGDPQRDVGRDVEVLAHARPFLSFFGHEEMRLRYRRHDGRMSAELDRSALLVGAAAVVLPYDPRRDRVLLVEQFRAPVYIAGDPAPWVWEPVAGLIDAGETAQQAARREALEEAGVTLGRLEPVAEVYSSTGSSGEFLHLFVGLADLETLPEGGGGVAGEGEDIVARLFSFDELMAAVDARAFADMPLVTAALWLARHRDRLRNGA
jgi:nudix-type nucleoside diphosphatase (YffH/AdpP family)